MKKLLLAVCVLFFCFMLAYVLYAILMHWRFPIHLYQTWWMLFPILFYVLIIFGSLYFLYTFIKQSDNLWYSICVILLVLLLLIDVLWVVDYYVWYQQLLFVCGMVDASILDRMLYILKDYEIITIIALFLIILFTWKEILRLKKNNVQEVPETPDRLLYIKKLLIICSFVLVLMLILRFGLLYRLPFSAWMVWDMC